MKRLFFILLIFVVFFVFSYNVFAFTFVAEGFPKEPDHNKKWIMFEMPNNRKYYFETAKEIDLYSLGTNDHVWFKSDVLNNGQPFNVYEHDGISWECHYSVSAWGFEVGENYKILYSNYYLVGEFNMAQPYLRYFLRCVNVSDILAFCIVIFSLFVFILLIKRIGVFL